MPVIDLGAKAPAFTLKDESGRDVALSDYRGKPLLLTFYPEADSPLCTKQACGFNDALSTLGRLGLPVLAISPDEPAALAAFARKFNLRFPLLSDPKDRTGTPKVMAKYGVWGEKTLYGNKIVGVIRTTLLLESEGKVIARWPGLRVPGHTERVLETARKLLRA